MEKQGYNSNISAYLLIFLTGFFFCILGMIVISFLQAGIEKPLGISFSEAINNAPGDWIKTSQIQITGNSIVINVPNASISSYAPTGSMRPVLDQGSNGIRIVPSSPEQIEIGDIVTFGEENIVHRVIEKGEDAEGYWFITKGDNNPSEDKKIRFGDIKYVTIGILY
jgi:hypothetical protein